MHGQPSPICPFHLGGGYWNGIFCQSPYSILHLPSCVIVSSLEMEWHIWRDSAKLGDSGKMSCSITHHPNRMTYFCPGCTYLAISALPGCKACLFYAVEDKILSVGGERDNFPGFNIVFSRFFRTPTVDRSVARKPPEPDFQKSSRVQCAQHRRRSVPGDESEQQVSWIPGRV